MCCRSASYSFYSGKYTVAESGAESVHESVRILAVIAGSPVILYDVLPQMQLPFVAMLESLERRLGVQ